MDAVDANRGQKFIDTITKELKKYKDTPDEETINMALFMLTARVISMHRHKKQQELIINFIRTTAENFSTIEKNRIPENNLVT